MEDIVSFVAAAAIFAVGSVLTVRYPEWRNSRPAVVVNLAMALYFCILAIQAAPHTRFPYLLMVALSLNVLRRQWVHARELRLPPGN